MTNEIHHSTAPADKTINDTASTTKFIFEWEGTSSSDLELALQISQRQIAAGYLSGFDSSDEASYSYRRFANHVGGAA